MLQNVAHFLGCIHSFVQRVRHLFACRLAAALDGVGHLVGCVLGFFDDFFHRRGIPGVVAATATENEQADQQDPILHYFLPRRFLNGNRVDELPQVAIDLIDIGGQAMIAIDDVQCCAAAAGKSNAVVHRNDIIMPAVNDANRYVRR